MRRKEKEEKQEENFYDSWALNRNDKNFKNKFKEKRIFQYKHTMSSFISMTQKFTVKDVGKTEQ